MYRHLQPAGRFIAVMLRGYKWNGRLQRDKQSLGMNTESWSLACSQGLSLEVFHTCASSPEHSKFCTRWSSRFLLHLQALFHDGKCYATLSDFYHHKMMSHLLELDEESNEMYMTLLYSDMQAESGASKEHCFEAVNTVATLDG